MRTWASQDLLNGAKHDTDHVKRIVLACERDMEDGTKSIACQLDSAVVFRLSFLMA